MKLLKVDTIAQVKEKLEGYFRGKDWKLEQVMLPEAIGRYTGEDIYAGEDLPAFTRSVVDGYAVVAKDTFGVSDTMPVFLTIVGEVKMGQGCDRALQPGETMYVPTGGILPQGADAMVMVEYVEKLDEETLGVYRAAAPGSGLMNRGDDFKAGDLLYPKGHRITVKDVGMLAGMGMAFLQVYAKPTVSILSTGDEVVSIIDKPGPGQVRDINSMTLSALAQQTGAKTGQIFLGKDSAQDLQEKLKYAIDRSDIVLLSGGSSAGNLDLTAETINAMGTPGVITHGIAMKPGKPTIVGVIEDEKCHCENRIPALAVGLPGHPMAAVIAYRVVVDYFIKKYYFHAEQEEVTVFARIAENLHAGEGRETFVLVRLEKADEGGLLAHPIHAKSGSISQLRDADGYVQMSDLSEGVEKGSVVEVKLFL